MKFLIIQRNPPDLCAVSRVCDAESVEDAMKIFAKTELNSEGNVDELSRRYNFNAVPFDRHWQRKYNNQGKK